MTDLQVSDEVSNLIFAGTDTTSTTLTYLFWRLAKDTDWQIKLRDEIDQNYSEDGSFRDIAKCPILNAVVHEALRLHPAAPASLIRVAPPGGACVGSFFVPGEVRPATSEIIDNSSH